MESEDDDTHICLKCHRTVVGLDNYVFHRKQECKAASRKVSASSEALIDPPSLIVSADATSCLSVSADAIDGGARNDDGGSSQPKADDFFYSLELQSSAAKNDSVKAKSSGVRTRKAVADSLAERKAKEKAKSGPKKRAAKKADKKRRRVLVEKKTLAPTVAIPSPKVDDTHPLDHLNLHPDLTEQKPHEDPVHFIPYEDHDHCPPFPISYTGGKWPPPEALSSTLADSFPDFPGGQYPPLGHTGGKWKPGEQPLVDSSHPPVTHTGGKWKPDHFEEAHSQTGGKWKTFQDSAELCILSDTSWLFENEEQAPEKAAEISKPSFVPPPAPGPTRGKWMPGKQRDLRKSGSTVEYYCKPCNRSLTSRAIYEKHLLSEYHFKRTLSAQDTHQKDGAGTSRNGKRTVKRNSLYKDCDLGTRKRRRAAGGNKISEPPQEDAAPPSDMQCEVCKAKVFIHLLGKHLVSHFHCFRAVVHPKAHSMVLNNMDKIVLQAPFQCGLCRFYCTRMEDFLSHWQSISHTQRDDLFKGYYRCSFCKHQCDTSEAMREHLTGSDHGEVVAMINKSVPIVIRKYLPLECPTCAKTFRYNLELKTHVRSEHGDATFLPPSEKKLQCSYCEFASISRLSLQKHVSYHHKEHASTDSNLFFCSICDSHFDSKEAAVKHRKTPEHRYLCEGRKGHVKTRVCPHCGDKFPGVPRLKRHIKQQHPECCSRCLHCGETFSLSQELAKHTQSGTCTSASLRKEGFESLHRCQECPFQSDSKAETLFHQAMHRQPRLFWPKGAAATEDADDMSQKTSPVAKYSCSICGRYFHKIILRAHLRNHLGERPFRCSQCPARFTSLTCLRRHRCMVHQEGRKRKTFSCEDCDFLTSSKHILQRHQLRHSTLRSKTELCDICGKVFYTKYNLVHHQKLHSGKLFKCPHPDCIFSCRSDGELQTHRRIHSEERPYRCDLCEYAGKTKGQLARHRKFHQDNRPHKCPHCDFAATLKSQLRRHMRLHTGAKPFKCPYCPYTCNLLENLRKHVLNTSKHPGKHMYECRLCPGTDPYVTNRAAEFRIHLARNHQDRFSDNRAIASYLAGLYDAESDPTTVLQSVPTLRNRYKPNRRKKLLPEPTPEDSPSSDIHQEVDDLVFVLPNGEESGTLNATLEKSSHSDAVRNDVQEAMASADNSSSSHKPSSPAGQNVAGPSLTEEELAHYQDLVTQCLQTLQEQGPMSPEKRYLLIFE